MAAVVAEVEVLRQPAVVAAFGSVAVAALIAAVVVAAVTVPSLSYQLTV